MDIVRRHHFGKRAQSVRDASMMLAINRSVMFIDPAGFDEAGPRRRYFRPGRGSARQCD
jgi:hypothetical protein